MAIVVKDRVSETSVTAGTGNYTLAGASTGYQSFSVIGNSNQTYYTATDGVGWEVGIGTYTSSGTTLSRDTILASSNSGNAVNWSSSTKNIFVVYPAGRASFSDNISLVSATAPSAPVVNQLWYDSTSGAMLIYYNSQWVEDYESQLDSTLSLPDMNGGAASTTSWTYSINCGNAS